MSYSHLFPQWVLHLVVYKTGGLETLASLNAPTISSISTTCFLHFTLSKIKHWQRELCCAKQELISGEADWATYKLFWQTIQQHCIVLPSSLRESLLVTISPWSGPIMAGNGGSLQVWSKVGVVCSQKARLTVNYSIYHLTHSVNLHRVT